MKSAPHNLENNRLVDVSEQHELKYWSEKLGVRPEVIKTAVRASRSNAIESIVGYLKTYKLA
ncbi:DUF3606 domain-containing protein [Pedobacter sp. PWIIR3]